MRILRRRVHLSMTASRIFAAASAVLVAAVFASPTAADPPEIRISFDAPTAEATDSGGADDSYHVKSYNPATHDPTDATCDIPAGTAGSGDFDAPTEILLPFRSASDLTPLSARATIWM